MASLRERRWFPLVWAVPSALVLLALAILAARALYTAPALADFFATHDGSTDLPEAAPVGFPAWLSWQHFLNAFLMVFLVRAGLLSRGALIHRDPQRPPAFVTRRWALREGSAPRRLSVHVWWHLVVDTLWALNGIVYVVLLFVSGQWVRIVPTSWDVFPEAFAAGVRYLALDWPQHDGWVYYNALQLLAYFVTVFVASPLAILSGLRLSPVWPKTGPLARVPFLLGARMHEWLLAYFLAFTVFHVGLVFATGWIENLDHMFAGRDDASGIGALVFAGSVVVTVVAVLLLRLPAQLRIAEATRHDVRRMPSA